MATSIEGYQRILGGGFAGVYAARSLEKLLHPEEATITLVNRENYWVYQPTLSEVIDSVVNSAAQECVTSREPCVTATISMGR
jgi:NADH dehydrogenase FAD-containing subunit